MRSGNSTFSANTAGSSRRHGPILKRHAPRATVSSFPWSPIVVRAYVDLRGFQVRAGILHKASDVLRESLRIVNIRYERGITNELDVALATRELATLEAQIAPVEAEVSAAQYALAVLVGEYPESMVQELSKPDLFRRCPHPPRPGVPLDLLKRRPDIQQAERELAAATARIGVATANLFPQVASSVRSAAQGTRLGNHARRQQAYLVVWARERCGRFSTSARSMPRSTLPICRPHVQHGAITGTDHLERRAAGGYGARCLCRRNRIAWRN